jgi:hypothetical protein
LAPLGNSQELLQERLNYVSPIVLPDTLKNWPGFITVFMLTAAFCHLVMKLQASFIAPALPYVLQLLK